MLRTVTSVPLELSMRSRPATTCSSPGRSWNVVTQCAAVSTFVGVSRAPPQKLKGTKGVLSATAHG